MVCEEQSKKKRVRRKLKLSVGQRKKQKQFTHNRSSLVKGDKYCKRKLHDLDAEECVPRKIQILDIENVNKEIIDAVCTNGSNLEDDNSENIVNSGSRKVSDTIAESTYRFYISEKPTESTQCLSGQNDFTDSSNNTDTENQDVNYICEEYYKKLCNRSLLIPLIDKLDRCNLLKDFTNLIEVLSNGTLEVENIPLLLCLERAKLYKCTTTTLMRFHPKSKVFWRVAYRTWHGKGLLLMLGSKIEAKYAIE